MHDSKQSACIHGPTKQIFQHQHQQYQSIFNFIKILKHYDKTSKHILPNINKMTIYVDPPSAFDGESSLTKTFNIPLYYKAFPYK